MLATLETIRKISKLLMTFQHRIITLYSIQIYSVNKKRKMVRESIFTKETNATIHLMIHKYRGSNSQ